MGASEDPRAEGNALLAALPASDARSLADILEPVRFDVREILYAVDEPIGDAVFPVDGVFSLITPMDDGRSVEVATVGREGFVGVPLFLQGRFTSAHKCLCQIGGTALRADAAMFLDAVGGLPALHTLLHRYTLALLTQIAQASACNRLHTLQERCARWLLLTHDRVGCGTFPLTQEFLGQMLGVRRAGVDEAQQALQEAGLIEYERGVVTIADRAGLEQRACECYGIIRDEHERLAGFDPAPSEH